MGYCPPPPPPIPRTRFEYEISELEEEVKKYRDEMRSMDKSKNWGDIAEKSRKIQRLLHEIVELKRSRNNAKHMSTRIPREDDYEIAGEYNFFERIRYAIFPPRLKYFEMSIGELEGILGKAIYPGIGITGMRNLAVGMDNPGGYHIYEEKNGYQIRDNYYIPKRYNHIVRHKFDELYFEYRDTRDRKMIGRGERKKTSYDYLVDMSSAYDKIKLRTAELSI